MLNLYIYLCILQYIHTYIFYMLRVGCGVGNGPPPWTGRAARRGPTTHSPRGPGGPGKGHEISKIANFDKISRFWETSWPPGTSGGPQGSRGGPRNFPKSRNFIGFCDFGNSVPPHGTPGPPWAPETYGGPPENFEVLKNRKFFISNKTLKIFKN